MQQDSLFSSDSPEQDQTAGPVTCLGKTLPTIRLAVIIF
jgi:hypothetical protein